MQFPNYFTEGSSHKFIKGENILCVQYIHDSNEIIEIHLGIDKPFFVHVVEGTVRLYSSSQAVMVEENQSAIVNVGSYLMSENLSVNNRFEAYLMFYSIDTLNEFYHKVNKGSRKELPQKEQKSIVKVHHCHFLSSFAQSLALLFKGNYESRRETKLIDIKAEELMYYFGYNNLSDNIDAMLFQTLDNDFIFKNCINNNYLNNIKLEDFAFLTGMSLSSFKRKFKEIYDESPSRWIKSRRLEHSISLLNDKKFSIKEVAYKCGFDNTSTFSRLFKSKYGISPKDYK
ncbi:AraC family transcriptional regulator [Winogradskyella sp. 3972H.M.0a.05]|uniref:helix-turn-helix transcriptional regulator n=1 Tax=Winogradskyella sp. 3972H.M.0a.05 TaxID=2950277 RepID=UPI00339B4A72